MFFCSCMMARIFLSNRGERSRISWNSSSTTMILSFSEWAFSISSITSSRRIVPSTPGWKPTSMEPVMGFEDIVGIMRKWDIKCLTRSIGWILKNSRSSFADKSATDVTCWRLIVILFRLLCFIAFATTLLFPNRRGLIRIRWFALLTNRLIYLTSFILSVK